MTFIDRIADGLENQFKAVVAAGAGVPFEETGVTLPKRSVWLGYARAAIEAMHDPTPEMVEAGMDYDEREIEIRLGRAPTVEECQIGEWQAMMDVALKD